MTRRFLMTAVALALAGAGVAWAATTPAKVLFSAVTTPSSGPPRSIGFYAKGCLAGAAPLPLDGPTWQVMRLSRNRHWGTPELVSYLEKFSADAAARDGWPGLLVGDMSQPRGGPMPTGHASHQIGLDADLWFVPMPNYRLSTAERESKSATSLLIRGRLAVDPKKWTAADARLLKRAASYPEVARIFVSAAIKKELCDTAGTDRAWLRKIRPWYAHDDHFHVRLNCPPGLAGCDQQAEPPPGDGCGAELAGWFKPKPPPKKPAKPRPPPPEITLADLPKACTTVLTDGGTPSPDIPVAATTPVTPKPVGADATAVPLPTLRPGSG